MSGTSPKIFPGHAHADLALDAVDELDRLESARENHEERRLLAFMDGVLAGVQTNVGRSTPQVRQPGGGEGREQGYGCKFVGGQHAQPVSRERIACAQRG